MKLIRKFGILLKQIGIKSLLIALIVLVITAGLATYIGIRVSATEKEVLLSRGKLNALEAAAEYDRCLLTRVNIVTLVGESVNNMLRAGTGNEIIRDYLVRQTENVIAKLDHSTTGLYGWINREYLDGAGWVPDDSYVAVERPWYTETMESGNEITFVEPYLDSQTHTVMMTVSDLLADGESVLAMDVSLDPIQEIIRKVVSGTEGSQAFVLDANGIVVAHSDETQCGLNYLRQPESLGGSIANRILRDGQMQFDVKAREGNYSVYVDRLEGGWYSVSLINADVWYRPLHRAMFLFVMVIVLVAAFLLFVFLRMSAKNIALQNLHHRISEEELRGKELQVLSETDRMTGLYDRVSGERRIRELLGAGKAGAFVEIDIDNFKTVNDTRGHQAGDRVIHAVADSFRSTFRTNDILMRLGGDEFVVFATGIASREMCEAVIRRLFAHIEGCRIPELPGEAIHLSVGAVLYDGEKETSFDELYAAADRAMYRSKKITGNSLTFSD